MRDINFFEPYKSRSKGENSTYYYKIIGLVVILLIVSTFSINISRILILEREIANYEEQLNKESIQDKVKEAEIINTQLNALTKYETDLDTVLTSVEDRDIVSNQILEDIDSTVPKNVDFKTMNINHELINIQAVTTSRQAIGEIQHNLKNISYISDVHIESISSSESLQGEYSFNIKCYLNGGDN